ncbi:ribonuclease P protein component [Paracoccus luteus]|uniref:ribonuclease P protein component n=1 Tax=Paracoccus luteus TaxID=2508543 RepID=UPI00106F9FA2|nr:ribonuclease P protein component [Paracoccus luteus]
MDRAGFSSSDGAAAPRTALTTLQKRADFLRAASARRQGTAGFLLQARPRGPADAAAPDALRVGFTCSKKLGNAVARNRAKRRLRALARAVLPAGGRPGWDYVLVGRPDATASRDFAALREDLAQALLRVHADDATRSRPPGPKRGRK